MESECVYGLVGMRVGAESIRQPVRVPYDLDPGRRKPEVRQKPKWRATWPTHEEEMVSAVADIFFLE